MLKEKTFAKVVLEVVTDEGGAQRTRLDDVKKFNKKVEGDIWFKQWNTLTWYVMMKRKYSLAPSGVGYNDFKSIVSISFESSDYLIVKNGDFLPNILV